MEINNNSFNDKGKLMDQSTLTETPLGDKDKHLKIQLCIEHRVLPNINQKRSKSRPSSKSKASKSNLQLDITVLWLKNVPKQADANVTKQADNSNPTPFVKIRLLPDDIMFTTEVKEGKVEAKFFETFNFPSETEDLTGKFLHVQVCNKKVTRRALAFGEVMIPLKDVETSKPITTWYDLK